MLTVKILVFIVNYKIILYICIDIDNTVIMIGIYKITNTKNQKVYIGKSIDIERRWKEHIRHSKDEFSKEKPPIHRAINKYGVDAFEFQIIEECDIEILNNREVYYITFYKSNDKNKGYNITTGGDGGPIMYGSSNPQSVLCEEDVIYIRECYKNGVYKIDCYNELSKRKQLNFNTFNSIWFGKSYKNIMPEVFTEENKLIHKKLSLSKRTLKHCNKVKSFALEIRILQKQGQKYSEVRDKYNFININTFNDIWCNRTFKYIQA